MTRRTGQQSSPGIVVVGSGGHAKVVIEAIRATGRFTIVGCTDAQPAASEILGVPVLGDDSELDRLFAQGLRRAFVALGSNALRVRIAGALLEKGFSLPAVVHPAATISESASIGRGTVVMAGAVVNASATIGDFCIINTLAAVDHDCRIGQGVHIAPRSALAGCVTVGAGSFLGAGAIAIPGVTIGENTTIGAGAVVVRDIPPGVVAIGIPARPRT